MSKGIKKKKFESTRKVVKRKKAERRKRKRVGISQG